MATHFPKAYEQLVATYQRLEKHYRDMQDLEFTVERGTLYLLQTRNGKRTGPAAVKIAASDKEARRRLRGAGFDNYRRFETASLVKRFLGELQ